MADVKAAIKASDIKLNRFPLVVEVEINSRCNRRCSYCPVSLNPLPNVPKWMSSHVQNALLDELEFRGFEGRLSYHFYNEPLLRTDISEIIAEVSKRVPKAAQVLYTNGDLLSDLTYARLIDAGIGQIVVTRHDGDSFPERPKQIVLHPRDLHITNRGGTLGRGTGTVLLPCVVPNELAVITVTGDVLLCYEDAKRANVFGNIQDDTLYSIWNSESANHFRRALIAGDRQDGPRMCRECNNVAHVEPGSTFFAL